MCVNDDWHCLPWTIVFLLFQVHLVPPTDFDVYTVGEYAYEYEYEYEYVRYEMIQNNE